MATLIWFLIFGVCFSMIFVAPYVQRVEKPPPKPPPPPPLPPAPPDLRSLDEKVEEYVRIMRAATQTERNRRKAERIKALRDWKLAFKALRKRKEG